MTSLAIEPVENDREKKHIDPSSFTLWQFFNIYNHIAKRPILCIADSQVLPIACNDAAESTCVVIPELYHVVIVFEIDPID